MILALERMEPMEVPPAYVPTPIGQPTTTRAPTMTTSINQRLSTHVKIMRPVYKQVTFMLKDRKIQPTTIHASQHYDISTNDILNHAFIRENKGKCSDFLNTLAQLSYPTQYKGVLAKNPQCMMYTTLIDGVPVITSVRAPGDNERRMWAVVLHACHIIKSLTPDLEMETPNTATPEDTLDESEVSVVSQNTEITKQVPDSTNVHVDEGSMLQKLATTEQRVALSNLSNRFIRLTRNTTLNLSITDTVNSEIYAIDIPSGLYDFLDSTVSTALRNYTLIKTDVEITIKVNANQAQCGYYVASHYPCYDQVLAPQDNVYRMLQRDHAIIDVAKSNDIVYYISYENLRPFLPIQTNEVGLTTGGNFARFSLRCLSPLAIADSGNPVCPVQVIARLVNTELTGMRYPVPTLSSDAMRVLSRREIQDELIRSGIESNPGPVYKPILEMDEVKESSAEQKALDTAKTINNLVGAIPEVGQMWRTLSSPLGNAAVAVAKMVDARPERIKKFEENLNYIGMTNKDRPVDIQHPTPLMPQPVHSYAYGRGPYNTKKLRLEPEATTPHVQGHETVGTTEDILELAKIPGLWTKFTVSTTQTQGQVLIELPAIPYDPRYLEQLPSLGLQPVQGSSVRQLPPVTYFSNMFQFYAGAIEYEFIPVKTPSHNFSIQVAFVPFNGNPGSTTADQLQSCNWKIIDFRTSSAGTYTVPWVSTNVMRLWPLPLTGVASVNNQNIPSSVSVNQGDTTMKDPGKVVVTLVNELNPTPIVARTIEVLVMMRATDNLRFLSPKQPAFIPTRCQDLTFVTRNGYDNTIPVPQANQSRVPTISGLPTRMPQLEMDDIVQVGDEKTLPTGNVHQTFGPQVQTLEKHDNLLDISRRFFLHTTVTGTRFLYDDNTLINSNYCASIPVTVYPLNSYGGTGNDFAPLVEMELRKPLTTPRDMISQCFRWFRGSMNFVIHNLSDYPVEVTHVPPTDLPNHITGGLDNFMLTLKVAGTSASNSYPMMAAPLAGAFPTEVIDPRVNPIGTVEVPAYTINNYMDLQAPLYSPIQDPLPDMTKYPQHDLLALTNGQLYFKQLASPDTPTLSSIRTARNAMKLRILSALGDDARYYHFMGTPPVVAPATVVWSMTAQPNPTRVLTRQEIQTALIAAGVESNPGPVETLKAFFQKCSSKVTDLTNTAALMGEFSRLLNGSMIAKMTNVVDGTTTILEEIKTMLSLYTTGLDLLEITSLALSLVAAMQKGASKVAILSAIVQVIRVLGVFHTDCVGKAITMISAMFANEEKEKDKVELQMDLNSNEAIIGIVVSLLVESMSAIHSVPLDGFDMPYVASVVKKFFTNFNFFRAGSVCLFFTRFSHVIKQLYQNVRRWVIGAGAYDILANDPNFVKNFMIDYEFFMNELNVSQQSHIRRHRDRFWTTVITAYYLKAIMATVKDNKLRNHTLNAAINDVIKRANDMKSLMVAPPVRYEPFVLWLHGGAGVGKTTLNEKLTIDIAKAMGITTPGDPFYVRNPNDDYWNGYNGQPIVLIDDANAVIDPTILGRALSEFQALKSSAKMRLVMARLEEKNTEMTSQIVGVCSNLRDWKSEMIAHKEAFLRRRDVLVEVKFSPAARAWFNQNGGKEQASSLPPHLLEKNAHLTFNVARDPTKPNDDMMSMSYSEFHQYLMNTAVAYHNKEMEKVLDRYKKSLELSELAARTVVDDNTLKIALHAVMFGSMTEKAQSEMMREAYQDLEKLAPQRFKALPAHTQYLLGQMRDKELQDDLPPAQRLMVAPDIARVANRASTWFKTQAVPAYFENEPSRFSFIKDKFAPWNMENVRQFMAAGMLTSTCIACDGSHTPDKPIARICAGSVESSQHWMCVPCYQAFVRVTPDVSQCPTCRGEEMFLAVHPVNEQWRTYHKIAHVLKTMAETVMKPVCSVTRATFKWILQNAVILTIIASLCATTAAAVYDITNSANRFAAFSDAAHMEEENLLRFSEHFGVLPDRYYAGPDGNLQCQLMDKMYVVTPSGVRALQEANLEGGEDEEGSFKSVNSEDDTIPWKEVTRKKGKELQELVDKRAKKSETYKKDSNISKHKTSKPSTPATSTQENIERVKDKKKAEAVFEKMEAVDCVHEHEESGFESLRLHIEETSAGDIKRKPTAPYLNLEKDPDNEIKWNFMANLHRDGEYQAVLLPLEKCKEEKCKRNIEIKRLIKYFIDQEKSTINHIRRAGTEWPDIFNCEDETDREERSANNPEQPTRYARFIQYQKELVRSLQNTLYGWLKKIYDLICEHWYWILTAVTAFIATYTGVKWWYSTEEGIQLESDSDGMNAHFIKKQTRNANQRTYYKNGKPRLEGAYILSKSKRVPKNVEDIAKLIQNQTMSFQCSNITLRGVVLVNNHVMVIRHTFTFMKEAQKKGFPVVMHLSDGTQLLLEKEKDGDLEKMVVIDEPGGEWCVLRHKRITGRDIRDHIFSSIPDNISYATAAYAVDIKDKTIVPIAIEAVVQDHELEGEELMKTVEVGGELLTYRMTMTDYFRSVGFRGPGKCGSLILDPHGKIIGIHFAGNMGSELKVGYAAILFRENFVLNSIDITLQGDDFPSLKFYSHYPDAPYHTDKSKIRPSAIADEAWESLTFPCIQSKNDPRYTGNATPLIDGAMTIGAETVPPEPDTLVYATDAVFSELIRNMPSPVMAPPVSVKEAVTASNHRNVESMNLSTSAGLPLISDMQQNTLKSAYVSVSEARNGTKTVTIDPHFNEQIRVLWKMRKEGVSPRQPFLAHLKDERRKPAKLLSPGGTRVFNVAPLELVLSSRRVLLPFMDAFHANPVELHHAIGVAPDSVKWTDLIMSLREKSDRLVQLDFSKYSDSMPWEFVHAAFQVIKRYYDYYGVLSGDVEVILDTLEFEITRSVVCIGNLLYELQNGVLQGHPLTSIINSLVNLLEQTYVWIKLTNEPGEKFFKECGIVVMGDDVVISVPSELLHKYNGKKIAEEFAKMKIKVTDENKDADNIAVSQPMSAFVFLSRSLGVHPYRDLYLAPPDMDSLFDCALWIRRNEGPMLEATKENVVQSLMLCFGHGPCIYEMYRATLEHLLPGTQFRSWFELDRVFYENEELDDNVFGSQSFRRGMRPCDLEALEKRRNRKSSSHAKGSVLYKCHCRFNCEKELMDRIKQVELKTGTKKEIFLPYLSQEEAARSMDLVYKSACILDLPQW